MDPAPAPVRPPPAAGNFWAGFALAFILLPASIWLRFAVKAGSLVVFGIWAALIAVLFRFGRSKTLRGLVTGLWTGFVIGAILVAMLFVYLLVYCSHR